MCRQGFNIYFFFVVCCNTQVCEQLDVFDLAIYYGGVFVEETEQKYVGGSMELFEGFIVTRMNLITMKTYCEYLGCTDDCRYMYRIPSVDSKLRLREIHIEENVWEMTCIGKHNGKAELYVVREFHIRLLNVGKDCSTAENKDLLTKVDENDASKGCSTQENEDFVEFLDEDLFHVDMTFDNFFESNELPVHATPEEVDGGKGKKSQRRVSKTVEDGDKADDSDDSCDDFHDSDYDCSKDEDDIIYKNCTSKIDKLFENQIGNLEVGMQGKCSETGAKENRKKAYTPKQEHAQVREAYAAADLNIYDGEQIPVQEESDSMNTEELNSYYGSSDEESGPKKPRYVRFRPEIDMKDPRFFVGLLFDTKKVLKATVDYVGVL